jgi:hypothetical protein
MQPAALHNGGTGSYMRLSRTLFIYYGGAAEWGGDRLRELLAKSFGEWVGLALFTTLLCSQNIN